MGLLHFLFGNNNKTITDFKNRGAIIIDVRSTNEYSQGAILNSENIPLPNIESKIDYLKSLNKPIITCCASGVRSGKAAKILKAHHIETVNGGGWASLQNKL
ncbi:rhodanese-like domain-containing protein [Algibacter miyuki]|uniref:Rhodanese-like domain-containing protein n=1 Tax=Algibacter miyuki TaxID=1306933 RepID=A0ABV5GXB4_9FLAO|nr:rhodanese-like domain-containing protein [Algibacter miyuki]MDN3666094.1 rhodanese-like domain-containing protein [Algibacter miyuki]